MFIQNTFSDSSLTVLLVSLLVFYPIFGSIVWIVGAIKYRSMIKTNTPVIPESMVLPKVSILVAAHNEELQIDNTIRRMLYDLNYPNYDLIIASDGSTDRTNEIVLEWTKKDPRVRLVEIQENMGKAHAITQAAFYSDAEFFLGIDADSFIIGDGLKDMMAYMLVDTDFSPANRVGAVTAAPTPMNRSSMLAKLQLVEYNSIIGLIKRAQSTIGRLFTVSGVAALYRRDAVVDAGYWDTIMAAEDIAMSWDIQSRGWRIAYSPSTFSYMDVPTTVKQLVNQRIRWAIGSMDVVTAYWLKILTHPRKTFPMIFLLLDNIISTIWSLFWVASMIITFFYIFVGFSWEKLYVFTTVASALVIFQFIFGMLQLKLSLNYGSELGDDTNKYFRFAGWYVWAYWILSPVTTVLAIPRFINRLIVGRSGTWTSPERTNLDGTEDDK